MKPIIEIHYYGGDEPRVVVPFGLDVEIRLVDYQKKASHVITHKGVSVYRCHNDYDMLSEYWVATMSGLHLDSEEAFDLRDLPEVPEMVRGDYEITLDNATIEEPLTAEDADREELMSLMYCIEKGWLTEDGLKLPKEVK